MIALQVSVDPETASSGFKPGGRIGAITCINFSPRTAATRIPEIGTGQNAEVYRLSQGDFVRNPDMERAGGMYVELIPWEVQVIFYNNKGTRLE